jgi:hypothetical protein
MDSVIRTPTAVLLISFVIMALATLLGLAIRRRQPQLGESVRTDVDRITAATLTLLGLIIGFTFSMAIERYDQRKNYEEGEANAIGTEYLRADFLPVTSATRVRALLKDYLEQRIRFYELRDGAALRDVDARLTELQNQLWSAVRDPGPPTTFLALTASGMNDVLNSGGYTEAAWLNRIPPGAWFLMTIMAIFANVLVGFEASRVRKGTARLFALPFILCFAFYSIADIDSPREGLIRVHAQNLAVLAQSLRAQ